MPALFIYLIKVNVALLIFCAGYYAVLRHLTFYNLNRVYLVTAIIFSTLYPLVDLAGFLNRHKEIAKPVQVIIINWQEPVTTAVSTFFGHDQWYWLQVAFWLGVVIFGIRLLMQLLSLYRLHKLSEPAQLHHYMIRVVKGDINPFSFWRNIYINPENHPANELNAILKHEQVHVNEWHTLDILLGEVSAVFYWFNPGIWLMKRAIRENIEFVTDQKILQMGVDSKAYQYSLLNVNLGVQGNTIVNHFNISTIKKRIMMMNAKRSRNIKITRYLFLLPAVMCLLLIFSVSKAELNKAVKSSTHMLVNLKRVITKMDIISNTANPATRKTKEALTAVSLFKIDKDTTVKGKSLNTFSLNYSFQYDSAGKKNNNGFHISMTNDTNKKPAFKIRGSNIGAQPDIYINGVKTEIGLDKLNPDNIVNINVVKDTIGNKNGEIYIVTKGANKFTLGNTIGSQIDSVSNRKRANADRNDLKIVTVQDKPITKVRINGKNYDTLVYTNAETIINGVSTHKGAMLTKKAPTLVESNGVVTIVEGSNLSPSRIVNVRASAAPISFANKLIIIDGKEATQKQMKKLSADQIDSISNLSSEAATTLYGDKAKNGVVVITTKK